MTITESSVAPAARTVTAVEQPTGLYGVVTTGDHKVLGRLYVGVASLYFLVVVVLGVLDGIEKSDTKSLSLFSDATSYFQSLSLYRLGLVFLVVLPLFVGLATAIVPLQVGSPAIAFPRAAAAAFWGWLVGSGVLVASFIADGGLGSLGGGVRPKAVGLTLLGLSMVIVCLLLASVCVATTVIAARTPGMSLGRVPLFSWSMLVASALWLVTLPVLLADLVLAFVDYRHGQLQFGLPSAINQQVAWAFWQPQVYAFAIPVLGIMSEIVPVAARVRQRFHDVQLFGIALFGVLSFGAATQSFDLQDNFLYPAMGFVVVLPVLIVVAGWADTLRQGRPSLKGPVGALALGTVSVLMLLAGVLTGFLRVLAPLGLLNTSATDAVFDLVLLGAAAAGAAGVVYWSPKLTGRMFPESLARLAALPLLAGIALAGIPNLVSGFRDQPGGIVIGPVKSGVQAMNILTLVGILLVGLGLLVFLAGLARTLAGGPRFASNNPWDGHTLEWATVSPPPLGNFSEPLPEVRSERPLLDAATEGNA